MSIERLSQMRIFVPGIMLIGVVVLLGLPWIISWYEDSLILSIVFSGTALAIVPWLLGAVYSIFGVRRRFMRESLERVNANIRDSLLAPYLHQGPIASAEHRLRRDNRLLDIFYDFIDNNESLKARSTGVYLNGLLWSSVIDLMVMAGLLTVMSVILLLILAVAGFLTGTPVVLPSIFGWPYYLLLALSGPGTYVVAARLMLPRVVNKHIELGERQTRIITQQYEDPLRQELKRIAKDQ